MPELSYSHGGVRVEDGKKTATAERRIRSRPVPPLGSLRFVTMSKCLPFDLELQPPAHARSHALSRGVPLLYRSTTQNRNEINALAANVEKLAGEQGLWLTGLQ